MNIERQVRQALVQASVGRLLSEGIGVGARVFHALGRGLDDVAYAVFYLELDGARKYELLTGESLGAGTGDPDRHVMHAIPLDEDEE